MDKVIEMSHQELPKHYDYYINGINNVPLAFKLKGDKPVINDAEGAIEVLIESLKEQVDLNRRQERELEDLLEFAENNNWQYSGIYNRWIQYVSREQLTTSQLREYMKTYRSNEKQ